MTVTSIDETREWGAIVRIDRKIHLPEDPTLHKAAVWWEVFSGLPDDRKSRLWATYVADVWAYSLSTLETLRDGASWLEQPVEALSELVVEAKARYDGAVREWRESSEDWNALEAGKTRRLIRYMIASQKRLVAAMALERRGGVCRRDASRARRRQLVQAI